MTTLSQVARLLERLHCYQQDAEEERLASVSGFLGRLNQKLPDLRREAQRVGMESSPQFNVFRILRLAHKEVQAHTPFLGELLNPKGTHGQGFVFLEGFFRMAQQRGLMLPQGSIESFRWDVRIEQGAAPYGNIDIVVRCLPFRYLLVIENKIWSGEQPDQLNRYADWMQTQNNTYDLRQLLFLTPTGRASGTIEEARYTRLSYHYDIRLWLHEALHNVKSPAVRETVRQYVQIVEDC